MTNLKPCPFCKDRPGENGRHGWDGTIRYFYTCTGCGADGPEGLTREEAEEKWNHRPSPWIRCTPETMPTKEDADATGAVVVRWASSPAFGQMMRWDRVPSAYERHWITHWMPLPEPPEDEG